MKIIRGRLCSTTNRDDKIKGIKEALGVLKQELDNLRNYRGGWTDLDVAILCWLLAHDKKELEFWKEVYPPEKDCD